MNRFSLSVMTVMAMIIALLSTCNSCYKAKIAALENKPAVVVNPIEVVRVDSIPVHDTIPVDRPVPVAYIPKGYVKATAVPPVIEYREAPGGEVHDSAYLAWLTAVKNYHFGKFAFERVIPTRYGNIIQRDTTEQNRLIGGQTILDFTIPEKTIIRTETIQPKRAVQLYVGIDAQGSRADLLSAFGPSLLLKTKGDQLYRLGALYNKDGFLQYHVGTAWKIKLH